MTCLHVAKQQKCHIVHEQVGKNTLIVLHAIRKQLAVLCSAISKETLTMVLFFPLSYFMPQAMYLN